MPSAELKRTALLASQVLASIWTDSFEANPDGSRSNRDFRFSKPSEGLYSSAWAWDSAWHILGNAYIAPERAAAELKSLFARQWENGMVPHILYGDDPHRIYYPGPDFWQTQHSTSSITQPPVWTFLIENALSIIETCHPGDATKFADVVEAHLSAMNASHRFFRTHRDPMGIGAVSTAHPWENGTDNCPANLMALEAVIPSEKALQQGREKAAISNVTGAGERPDETYYARTFEVSYGVEKVDNSNPGLFNIYDPLMTATLLYSEWALVRLAQRFGKTSIAAEAEKRAQELSVGLQKLWDAENKRYSFLNTLTGHYMETDSISCYVPLLCVDGHHAIPEAQLSVLIESLFEKAYIRQPFWGLPSASPTHERLYNPTCYWLGPVWTNVSSLIETGIRKAKTLYPAWDIWARVPSMIEPIVHQCAHLGESREYFSANEYKGLGARGFGWTAAILLRYAMDILQAEKQTGTLDEIHAVWALNNKLYSVCREKKLIDKHNTAALFYSVSSNGESVQASINPAINTIADNAMLTALCQGLVDVHIECVRPGKLHMLKSSGGVEKFMDNLAALST